MPRGIYARNKLARKVPRKAPRVYGKPIRAAETFDIAQGGFVDLKSANGEISELKDRIAMLNQELSIAKNDAKEADQDKLRFQRIIDKLTA